MANLGDLRKIVYKTIEDSQTGLTASQLKLVQFDNSSFAVSMYISLTTAEDPNNDYSFVLDVNGDGKYSVSGISRTNEKFGFLVLNDGVYLNVTGTTVASITVRKEIKFGSISDASISTATGQTGFTNLKMNAGTTLEDLYVVGNSALLGNLDVDGDTTLDNVEISGATNITNTTGSTDSTTGALVVDGGVGIAKNLYVGDETTDTGGDFIYGIYENGTRVLTSTSGSGSELGDAVVSATNTNGELVLVTDKFVHVGTSSEHIDQTIYGQKTWKETSTFDGTLDVNNASDFSGDVTLSAAADLIVKNAALTPANVFTIDGATGNTAIAGTLGVSENTTLTGDLAVNGGDLTTSGTSFNLLNTNATTVNAFNAATTIDVGSTADTAVINLNSTKEATSSTVGAVVVDGGLAVAKKAYVGTDLNVGGSTTLTGLLNANSGIAVDTNKFTVQDETGNTFIAGALEVDGTSQLDGAVDINNSLTVDGSNISLDSTGAFNLNLDTNSGSATTLSIQSSNSGAGAGNISVTADSTTITSDVTIDGNLNVSGTINTVNVETISLTDNFVRLNSEWPDNTAPSNDAGIEVYRGTGTNSEPTVKFFWDESEDEWSTSEKFNIDNNLTVDGTNISLDSTASSNLTVTGATSTESNLTLAAANTSSGNANVLVSAKTEIGLTAPTIDINGDVHISDDLTVVGSTIFGDSVTGDTTLINGVTTINGTTAIDTKTFIVKNSTNEVFSLDSAGNAIFEGTVNDLTLTAATTGFTIAGGTTSKTLTVNNSLTFTGTDESSAAFGTGGTVAYTENKLNVFADTTASELRAKIKDGANADTTGTEKLVFSNSPVLTTPTLGAASATSINGLTIDTTTGTLDIANGKTLTVNDSSTITGTGTVTLTEDATFTKALTVDTGTVTLSGNESGSSVTLPASGTLATLTGTEALTNKTVNGLTISTSTGTLTIADGKTLTVNESITLTGDAARTLTINTANKTLAGAATTLTFGGDFTTSGAHTTTFTTSGTTSLTLPTSGTLVSKDGDNDVTGIRDLDISGYIEKTAAANDANVDLNIGVTNSGTGTKTTSITLDANTTVIGEKLTVGTTSSLGGNVTFTNAANRTLNIAAVTGTDAAGKTLTIASGQGTGEGTVSTIAFQTPTADESGTTAQDLETRLLLNSSGASVTGNLIVSGNLTISGSTTTVNTEEIKLADNIIVLNSNFTGNPESIAENAGIEIERGTGTNAQFLWNETTDSWGTSQDFAVTGNTTFNNVVVNSSFTLNDGDITTLGEITTGTFNATTLTAATAQVDDLDIDEDATSFSATNWNVGTLNAITLNAGTAEKNSFDIDESEATISTYGTIGTLNAIILNADEGTKDSVDLDVSTAGNLLNTGFTNITNRTTIGTLNVTTLLADAGTKASLNLDSAQSGTGFTTVSTLGTVGTLNVTTLNAGTGTKASLNLDSAQSGTGFTTVSTLGTVGTLNVTTLNAGTGTKASVDLDTTTAGNIAGTGFSAVTNRTTIGTLNVTTLLADAGTKASVDLDTNTDNNLLNTGFSAITNKSTIETLNVTTLLADNGTIGEIDMDVTTAGNLYNTKFATINTEGTVGTLNVTTLTAETGSITDVDVDGITTLNAFGTIGTLDITGALTVDGSVTLTAGTATVGELNVDNIQISGNTISTTTGDLTINAATGNVTATSFVGSLSGNATSATSSSKIAITDKTTDEISTDYYITFTNTAGTGKDLLIDTGTGDTTIPVKYNPKTKTLMVERLEVAGDTVSSGTVQYSSFEVLAETNPNFSVKKGTDSETATLLFEVDNNGNVYSAGHLVFEGSVDEHQTILSAVNPTVDQTYQLPNKAAGTYTLATTSDLLAANTEISEAEIDSTTSSTAGLITGRRANYILRNNVTETTTANLATGATLSTATKTVNLGTGGASGSTTNINIGSSVAGTTTISSPSTVITGNLIVNGTSTVLNTSELSIEDKNIELGTVRVSKTATINGTVTMTVTNASGLIQGQRIFGPNIPAGTFISAITGTTITMSQAALASASNIEVFFGASDTSANGGGIILEGTTDKTILWNTSSNQWDFNKGVNVSGNSTVTGTSTFNNVVVNSSFTLNGGDITTTGTLTAGTFNATTLTVGSAQVDDLDIDEDSTSFSATNWSVGTLNATTLNAGTVDINEIDIDEDSTSFSADIWDIGTLNVTEATAATGTFSTLAAAQAFDSSAETGNIGTLTITDGTVDAHTFATLEVAEDFDSTPTNTEIGTLTITDATINAHTFATLTAANLFDSTPTNSDIETLKITNATINAHTFATLTAASSFDNDPTNSEIETLKITDATVVAHTFADLTAAEDFDNTPTNSEIGTLKITDATVAEHIFADLTAASSFDNDPTNTEIGTLNITTATIAEHTFADLATANLFDNDPTNTEIGTLNITTATIAEHTFTDLDTAQTFDIGAETGNIGTLTITDATVNTHTFADLTAASSFDNDPTNTEIGTLEITTATVNAHTFASLTAARAFDDINTETGVINNLIITDGIIAGQTFDSLAAAQAFDPEADTNIIADLTIVNATIAEHIFADLATANSFDNDPTNTEIGTLNITTATVAGHTFVDLATAELFDNDPTNTEIGTLTITDATIAEHTFADLDTAQTFDIGATTGDIGTLTITDGTVDAHTFATLTAAEDFDSTPTNTEIGTLTITDATVLAHTFASLTAANSFDNDPTNTEIGTLEITTATVNAHTFASLTAANSFDNDPTNTEIGTLTITDATVNLHTFADLATANSFDNDPTNSEIGTLEITTATVVAHTFASLTAANSFDSDPTNSEIGTLEITTATVEAHTFATLEEAQDFDETKTIGNVGTLNVTTLTATDGTVTDFNYDTDPSNTPAWGTVGTLNATILNAGTATADEVDVDGVSTLTAFGTIGSMNITGALSVTGDVELSAGTAQVDGDLTIGGDLNVTGTINTINATVLQVEDINIELGKVSSPSNTTANGGGITLLAGTDVDKTITWNTTGTNWTSSENWNIASGKVFKINNTEVLSSTTLGSGITGSSLTSVGTITTGVWQGTSIAVANGGTGATTAANARINLDLEIGVDVQAYDAGLNSIAALTTTADRMIYTTASDTYAVTTLTEFARSILDDADAAAVRSTIGAQAAGTYLTAEADTLQSVTERTNGSTTNVALTLSNAAPLTLSATTATVNFGNTGTRTVNLFNDATASGQIKAINLGTGGLTSSTTNINIGSTTATGTTAINSGTALISMPSNNNMVINPANGFDLIFDTTAMTIDASDTYAVTIGTSSVSENLFIYGNLYFPSDERLKDKHEIVSSSILDSVLATDIWKFSYKAQPDQVEIGVMAQELERNFPTLAKQLVTSSETEQFEDQKALKESKLVYVLWAALQEETKKRKELEEKINKIIEKLGE
jgi:hypothetical protein